MAGNKYIQGLWRCRLFVTLFQSLFMTGGGSRGRVPDIIHDLAAVRYTVVQVPGKHFDWIHHQTLLTCVRGER